LSMPMPIAMSKAGRYIRCISRCIVNGRTRGNR
jgi:hypothetical protein